MSNLPALNHPWPPMLLMDLAIGLDSVDEILIRHKIDAHTWEVLTSDLNFRRELMRLKKEVAEDGTTFKRKAAIHAETYLLEMDALMRDASTPPNVKHEIFKTLAKLGGLETKVGDESAAGSGPSFAIQINLN